MSTLGVCATFFCFHSRLESNGGALKEHCLAAALGEGAAVIQAPDIFSTAVGSLCTYAQGHNAPTEAPIRTPTPIQAL
jgi:hypothetical protein